MTIKIPDSLPWVVGWGGDPELQSKDDAGPLFLIAGVGGGGFGVFAPNPHSKMSTWETVEDATDYLLHAANNYPALVRALEGIVEHIEKRNLDTFDAMLQKLQIEASAALRAAKGE